MSMKEILGFTTIILAITGLIPYFLDILKGKTKPHLYSWILWTVTSILVFVGQIQKGAGAGAWNTGIVGCLSLFITVLTFKKGAKDITKSDKLMFAIALLSIIPWLLTKDPTLSIIILTGINLSAVVLTMRKTLKHPGSESLILYSTNIIRHFLAIIALSNYNLATYIFPSSLFIANILMVFTILKPSYFFKRS